MIRSQNLLNNRIASVPAPLSTSGLLGRTPASAPYTFTRIAPSQRHAPAPRFVATQALLSPEDAVLATQLAVQAATMAGGAAGVMRGRDLADDIKQRLALFALLLPPSSNNPQRLEGAAARGAEACYDAATIAVTGMVGALAMHILATSMPLAQLFQL